MNHFIELTELNGDKFLLNTNLILRVKALGDDTLLTTSIPRDKGVVSSYIPARIDQHHSCIKYEVKESYEKVMALILNK
ncbi:MAG TPA: flagellar FlbD family protein [Prolixibacteraceae bacterium]|nr:flagellar FlbD family protein [Prolixibacteraceae bacterium]